MTENDIINRKGNSAVLKQQKENKRKQAKIRQDPKALADYIFGNSDKNPLEEQK